MRQRICSRHNRIPFLRRWLAALVSNVRSDPTSVPCVFVLAVCVLGCTRPRAGDYCHVWKCGLSYDKPISDIDQWAADNFADAPNARLASVKLEKFELDINHDGAPETFLTTPLLQGNGGGPHLVFQKRGQFFFYLGQLPGRNDTMRVLPMGADGLPRVLTFSAGGANGIAHVWKGDGKKFTIETSEEIQSGDSGTDEGRRRFEALFGSR